MNTLSYYMDCLFNALSTLPVFSNNPQESHVVTRTINKQTSCNVETSSLPIECLKHIISTPIKNRSSHLLGFRLVEHSVIGQIID